MFKKNLLFNTAGEANGGGNSGTVLGGGGGSGANAGDATAGSGNNSGAGATNNTNTTPNANAGTPADWRMALPKELQEDPSLKSIQDVQALAKSYVNAQKLVGAEKIAIPSKHATDDDWKVVFQKLGLPADIKDFEVKSPDGANFDENFIGQFKEAAHKNGVLPKQAQNLVNWFGEANTKAMNDFKTVQATARAKEIDGLKTEWGEAFTAKVGQAKQVIDQYGGEDFRKYLDSSGLGNDTQIIRLLAKVGESMKESGIKGSGGGFTGPLAPSEALKSINSVMADLAHPYHVKAHPNHGAAVTEMQTLYSQAYPQVKK